ncbi:hypothetical protein [Actinoplanes sp. RD1]|uniref:hypothetical protein n=1 Tax=Actinoplanes sp. RD1 TaxID=3064538 RepID=UPI002741DFB5|nr:hypothetical protein [Actinoplanes sp. RD1]
MKTLPCGHVAHAAGNRLCRHVFDAVRTDYYALLTGRGIEADLCCAECVEAAERGDVPPLVKVCEGCYDRRAEDVSGWRGEPGITERPEPVDGTLLVTPLPDGLGTVLDVAGVPGRWLVLTADARLSLLDPAGGGEEVAAGILTPEPDERPRVRRLFRHRLHVDGDGRFAAVVNDHGRHGRVVDLRTGRVTMTLHGGGGGSTR